MNHVEMVALLRGGTDNAGMTWADLGAGTGNFTRALRDLLGEAAKIYAVDRDSRALGLLRDRWPPGDDTLYTIPADFTGPLDLPPLDGILMANALHFIRDQRAALEHITAYLGPGGRLILVEYDVKTPRSFIPYPVPYARFETLATTAGLIHTTRLNFRESPSTGMVMYAAMAEVMS